MDPMIHYSIDEILTAPESRTDGGCQWVGGAQHGAASLDGIKTLPNHSDNRARCHVLYQTREERLALKIGIVCSKDQMTREIR